MREFEHPNYSCGFVCPVCKTSTDKPVVLVGIPGTEDGWNMEAEQVHALCQSLVEMMRENDTTGTDS